MKCCKDREKKGNAGGEPRIILVTSFLLLALSSYGQAGSPAQSFGADPFNHPMLPFYITMGFVVVTVLLLVGIIVYLVKTLNVIARETEMARAARSGMTYSPAPSWFEEIWQKLNATVPVSKEADIDLGHDFDGIRELDNHLPPWWKGLFYVTVIWAVVYLFVYHVTPVLPLQTEEYAQELSDAREQARAMAASRPKAVIDENTLVFANDAEIIGRGKAVFVSSNCGSCHRNDAGGNNIGPNLTDEYWIHGGAIKNVFLTIKEGVVEKGMPAWGKTMSAEDVKGLAFYIMSLQGTNPPGAKKAQGELYVPEKTLPTDSTQVQASLTTQ